MTQKSLNPQWNQLLTFQVIDPETESLCIKVYDKDLIGVRESSISEMKIIMGEKLISLENFQKDYLGETTVGINDLIEGYEKLMTCPLEGVSTGEITIGLKAVNWSGSSAHQSAIAAQQAMEQYPQQPQYQQPGFFNQLPNGAAPDFQFPSGADQYMQASNPYAPVPFIAPVNAAQLIPGYHTPPPHQSPKSARAHVGESAMREGFNVHYSEIQFEKKLGAGAFGEVWKGEWAGTPVAIKKILAGDIKESDLEEFAEEVLLMR